MRRSSTVPPATDPAPRTRERQTVAVDIHPRGREARPAAARSGGPRLLVAVEPDRLSAQRGHRRDEAEHRACKATFDARARPRGDGTADSSARRRHRRWRHRAHANAPIIRSVSRLRNAPLMVDVPCGVASAASTSARLVCDLEPGTVTVACTGVGVDGACQVLTASILPCRFGMPPWDICVGDSR